MMGDKMKISFVLVVSDRSEERRGFCIRTMDKGSVKKGKMEGSGVDWGGVVLLVFLPRVFTFDEREGDRYLRVLRFR